MNKAIAIMFIVLLLLLASGLAVSTYHLDKQIEINFNNAKVTDSLNEEIFHFNLFNFPINRCVYEWSLVDINTSA